MVRDIITNTIEILALWFIVYGFYMIWEPLGFITLGAGLLVGSYGYTRNG